MPEIGEIKKGSEIGKGNKTGRFIWLACLDCGKERWVRFVNEKPVGLRCYPCSSKLPKHHPWPKEGRTKNNRGYILIRLHPDDFFFSMIGKNGYVLEHRLAMAKHLKRCLLPWEVVHHKNGIKDDNRLENLALLGANSQHNKELNKEINNLQRQVGQLQQRVTLLEAENIMLNKTLGELIKERK